MSGLQIQYQLSGRPTLLAGSAGAFLNGRSVVGLAGPVTLTALTYPLDVLQPRSIGGNLQIQQISFAHHVGPLVRGSLEHKANRECAKSEVAA